MKIGMVIISCNRNSVINEIAGKDGLEDLFLEILVKKSEIIFEKISFISFCFTNRNDRKFHSIGSFNPGDKYFYIRGKSTLIKDTIVELEIVFSGDLYACFDENSIIPISYKGNVIISEKEIININDEADKRCSLNFLGNDLTKLDVNNSISPFYNEQFKHKFFNLNQLATNSFEMSDIV